MVNRAHCSVLPSDDHFLRDRVVGERPVERGGDIERAFVLNRAAGVFNCLKASTSCLYTGDEDNCKACQRVLGFSCCRRYPAAKAPASLPSTTSSNKPVLGAQVSSFQQPPATLLKKNQQFLGCSGGPEKG